MQILRYSVFCTQNESMKFWKQYLFTATILFAIIGLCVFYSCEKDPCTDQSCQHGGSCGNGVCTCPVGYDGPSCEYKTVNRFLGAFAGTTVCNDGAGIIDTAFVVADTAVSPLTVKFVMHTNRHDTLIGTVGLNQSAWSITIPIETATKYYKIYTVTLQSNNKLTVNTYSDNTQNPNIEVIENCNFVGWWTKIY